MMKLYGVNTLCTHPANMEELRAIMAKFAPEKPEEPVLSPPMIQPMSMRFFTSTHLPHRSIRKVWHPPEGDRFVEYGPEDEEWMRPLGLGTIEEIDEGPLFYGLRMPSLLDSRRMILSSCS